MPKQKAMTPSEMTALVFKFVGHNSTEWKEAVALREDVLRKPLGQVFSAQELEAESEHFHVAGYLVDALIATAVLVPEGNSLKMQRVAVNPSHRNENIGSRMMEFCETWAREHEFDNIYCHARDTAVNFYVKNKYSKEGDYFDEDRIPHLKMVKHLAHSTTNL